MNANQCPNFEDCPQPPNFPITGYNAESNEVIQFIARGFGPITPPPLNWNFKLPFSYATASSSVSLASAKSTANTMAVSNAEETWTAPGAIPPIEPGDSLVDYVDVPPLL